MPSPSPPKHSGGVSQPEPDEPPSDDDDWHAWGIGAAPGTSETVIRSVRMLASLHYCATFTVDPCLYILTLFVPALVLSPRLGPCCRHASYCSLVFHLWFQLDGTEQ